MSALKQLLRNVVKVIGVVDTIGAAVSRISRRPPRASTPPPAAPARYDEATYREEHCFSRDVPTEPPAYCYYCRQLKTQATVHCPGVPKARH